MESLLVEDQIDPAVTVLEKESSPGIHSMPLIELPLVLLVATDSNVMKTEQLWEQDKIKDALICLPEFEALCKTFQQRLTKLSDRAR